MTGKEPKPRDEFIAIELQQRAQQAAHQARIDTLEFEQGVPLSGLRALYGDEIMDHAAGGETIRKWQELLDTLRKTDKAMVALVGTKKELAPGCYGFGQRARYGTKADVIIISNPHDAALSFQEDEHTHWAQLDAQGYQLLQPFMRDKPEFDDLTEAPNDIHACIAVRGKSAWSDPAYDTLSIIAAGDTFSELYDAVEDTFVQKEGPYNYEQRILDRALSRLSNAWWQIAKKQRTEASAVAE